MGDAEGAEAAARGTAGGQSYLVAVVERAAGGGPAGAAGEVEVGMVAVETSTGDVLHAQFRCRALLSWWLQELDKQILSHWLEDVAE